jgi:hypothetical protein
MRRQLTPQRSDVGMLASVALAKLALHLLLSGRYGYWFWPKVKCWTSDRPAFMRPPPVPARSADASP